MKKIPEIYLDYNATTPCDPRVVEKMLPFFRETYGNPSNGLHIQGRKSAKAVDDAREQVAGLINARSNEIVFTSGATESDNLAILGIARMNQGGKRKRIVTCAIEHKAVLLPCVKLKENGFDVVFLPVDKYGRVSIDDAKEAIDDKTLLVTIHSANNEVGTLQAIKELAEIAHEHGSLFHCDGAQAVGKISINVIELGVDLLSISAHKLYGPKGIGALYMCGGSNAIPLEPIWYGGGQEKGLRSGTSNVPGIVGFGEACSIVSAELENEFPRLKDLRDQIESLLEKQIPSMVINGFGAQRLPNTSSLTFPTVDGDALVLNAPEIMIGTGSACTSGAIEPSHVLTAMGVSREDASSTIRISLGRFNKAEQLTTIITAILVSYNKNRERILDEPAYGKYQINIIA
jgi:cysteine desulfurase